MMLECDSLIPQEWSWYETRSPILSPENRARTVSLRATSRQLRSPRRSGSCYAIDCKPSVRYSLCRIANRVTQIPCLNHYLAESLEPTEAKVLNKKLIVPEKNSSIFLILSPVSTNSLKVLNTGNPAPTVASWNPYPPSQLPAPLAEAKIESHRVMSLENPFLFGVAM